MTSKELRTFADAYLARVTKKLDDSEYDASKQDPGYQLNVGIALLIQVVIALTDQVEGLRKGLKG
jgi:hypothetical protein